MKFFSLLAIVLLVPACSYNAAVVSTSAPASEIRVDRVREGRAGVVLGSEVENLNKEVNPSSYTCTAHKYPLEIGTALKQSIRSVIASSFSDMEFVSDTSGVTSGNPYTFIFHLEDFEPRLSFATGFWQGTATANVELVMRVTVLDENGNELIRTTIAGEGNEDEKGGCPVGAETLALAGQEAIKRMLENFVYKVINSDQIPTITDHRGS